jgi:DNA-nicking Smr family endonuclease
MPVSIKDFSGLKSLQKDLKSKEEVRKVVEEKRIQDEKAAQLERDLFRRSIGDVAPLTVSNKLNFATSKPLPIARHHFANEQAALRESLSDEFTIETLLETDEALSYARNGIGQDVVRKLRRGHWVIQSQLDLHGLRTDEAREALGEFLRGATKRGQRCVRVIHGKGLGSINKEPVLKNKVRNWLAQKDQVLAFCQAKAADGGAGALVVLLRPS